MPPKDPKTTAATAHEVSEALQYEPKILQENYTEALEPLDDGRDYRVSGDVLLGEIAESWKNQTKESWSLKIQDNIEDGSERRSWISRGIATASWRPVFGDGTNFRLYRFCGMHYHWSGTVLAWTLRMMKSLLAQLLAKACKMENCKPNIGWTLYDIKNGAADDLPRVIEAFKRVCLQLPDGTMLHIILDHLHLYWDLEEKDRSHVLSALGMFDELIKAKEKKVFVKLILTSSEAQTFFGVREESPFKVDHISVHDSSKMSKPDSE